MKSSLSQLTNADVDRILDIVNRIDDVDLRLQIGDISLHVRKGNVSAHRETPLVDQPARVDENREPIGSESRGTADTESVAGSDIRAPMTQPVQGGVVASDLENIVAPMMGRFYSRPSPNDPAFVEIGTAVTSEDSVCIIEVMKLFNTVKAGTAGIISEILVQDGDMIEEGDVLFRIRPS